MVHRTTSDKASRQWDVAKLDAAHGTGSISTEEQQFILRVFYEFQLDSNRTHSSSSTAINARGPAVRIFGRAHCTVRAIVAKWLKLFELEQNLNNSISILV